MGIFETSLGGKGKWAIQQVLRGSNRVLQRAFCVGGISDTFLGSHDYSGALQGFSGGFRSQERS